MQFLILYGDNWRAEIDEMELVELWVLLNKGPVDSSRLMKNAQEHISPLFSLLSTIDYIRPVEVSRDSSINRLALELRHRKFTTETVNG
ncbi:MAG: hypothetical protein DI591_10190 [Citromicrobium sp.]|nr:MAG: hypothetical protein DI591_10190 [Citromicrobium sp.]